MVQNGWFFRRRRRNYLGVRGRAVGSRLWCCDKSSLASSVLRWIFSTFGLMLWCCHSSCKVLHLHCQAGYCWPVRVSEKGMSGSWKRAETWDDMQHCYLSCYFFQKDLSVTYSQHWVCLSQLWLCILSKNSAKHLHTLLSFPRLSQDASALRRTARSFRTRKVPIWIFRVTLQNSFGFFLIKIYMILYDITWLYKYMYICYYKYILVLADPTPLFLLELARSLD